MAGLAVVAAAQEAVQKVTSVTIRGNSRIETSAIQGRLTLKAGDPYSPDAVRKQMRLLYETGFFEDVQSVIDAVPDGMAVSFIVKEKPFIT